MLSHLYSLNIDINSVNSNDLYEMAQICKNLNELIVDNCSQDIPGLIYLIDAQKFLDLRLSFDNLPCSKFKNLAMLIENTKEISWVSINLTYLSLISLDENNNNTENVLHILDILTKFSPKS
ncbi:hypothetical protein RhiirB3_432350 [Rhizophagus irregularis]|nr:hypothetical protein RhiirB3_432350 [Rhizophagus irregularis]